jgi:SAM-dependent methyltransferase
LTDADFIDVRELIRTLSVEELCQEAEEYFARLTNWDYQLSKPFALNSETPELLLCFAQVLQGLQPAPEMSVLDFGAGTCWASRYLTQLGLQVIALDVSSTALKIGQELYARHRVFGDKPAPRFSVFDGHKIDLPDASVDRIMCLEAFHHVPNPSETLEELCRVLKEGGIAGFAEPGPNHSKSARSQYEMRHSRVVENDINIREIWGLGEKAGFTRIELSVFNSPPFYLPLEQFEDYLKGGSANRRYMEATRAYMQERRVFFLHKGEPALADSRRPVGLLAKLSVSLASPKVTSGTPFSASVIVENSGSAIWLPTTAKTGAVHLGCHLFSASGKQLDLDYFRQVLTSGEGRPIQPGETLGFEVKVPSPPKGHYVLEFDLVSEMVCWFALNGSQTVRVAAEVF